MYTLCITEFTPVYRYVHVLGDAFPILTDPCLGWSTTYPWAMTIATAASLVTFTLEWVLHKTLHQRLMRNAERNPQVTKQPDAEAPMPENTGDLAQATDHNTRLKTMKSTVVSYTFEAGIIFHSMSACLFFVAIATCQIAALL